MNRALILIGIALANAARGIRRASTTSLLAVLTIAVVLVLVGSAWLLVDNMAGLLDEFGSELGLTAYLDPALDEASQRALAERLAEAPGVEAVELVTQDEALVRFEALAGSAELLTGLAENPLPPSLEIRLAPAARTEAALASLKATLAGSPGVEDLAQGQEWIEGYERAIALVRGLTLGLGVVLALAALLIVANTIRLAIYARRDELDILALVGASRTFVRVPFLLEGTIQGLLGGLLALALVFGAFALLRPQLEYGLELVLGRAGLAFFTTGQAIALVVAGAALGLLGSITALVGWKGTS
ncbi:MAG: permease-like cell division protein FtsX [Myxococcota bacterium]